MSVQRVTLTASDEKFAPPEREIEIAVIGNDVFITVYDGSLDDTTEGRKKVYEVPMLSFKDLVAALNAFGDITHSVRFVRSPESSA